MSLEAFFDAPEAKPVWGSPVEKEIRLRIKLAVAAYAYEFDDNSIITDAEFDKMCLEVNPTMSTKNRRMDNFFKNKFDPSTGQWIHSHPDLKRIQEIYEKYYK